VSGDDSGLHFFKCATVIKYYISPDGFEMHCLCQGNGKWKKERQATTI